MGIADGNVTGVTKVLDQGPDSSQWNLVVMGDGYTATQQSSFDTVVDNFIDILVTVPPFSEAATWDHVNVHRINIESNPRRADGRSRRCCSQSLAQSRARERMAGPGCVCRDHHGR